MFLACKRRTEPGEGLGGGPGPRAHQPCPAPPRGSTPMCIPSPTQPPAPPHRCPPPQTAQHSPVMTQASCPPPRYDAWVSDTYVGRRHGTWRREEKTWRLVRTSRVDGGCWGCVSGATTRGKGLAGPRQLGVGAGGCQGVPGAQAALGGISRGHRWQRVHGQTQPPPSLARAVGTAGHTDVSRAGVHRPPKNKCVQSLGWDPPGAAPARTYQLHAAGVAIPALGALLQHAGGSRLQ